MAPEPTFEMTIQTLVSSKDSEPWVVLSIWYWLEDDDPKQLMATWTMPPQEARERGRFLMQAAEASEVDASLVMVLRSRKIPEEEIQEIIEEMRNHRMRRS